MTLDDLYKNSPVLTDDYNLGHWLMKCNVDWETSHIYNRNRSMILFGFWENVIHTLDTKITDKMIVDANRYAVEMDMPFPRKLFERVGGRTKWQNPTLCSSITRGYFCSKRDTICPNQ